MVVKFKLLTSFIFSIIATVFYLIVTNFMDTIMSPKMSNMIGLLLDFTLDYMVQSKIFLDKIHFNKTQVGKAIIGKLISGVIATTTFNIYYDNLHTKLKSNTYIRILSITTSLVINLVIRKYWIYTK